MSNRQTHRRRTTHVASTDRSARRSSGARPDRQSASFENRRSAGNDAAELDSYSRNASRYSSGASSRGDAFARPHDRADRYRRSSSRYGEGSYGDSRTRADADSRASFESRSRRSTQDRYAAQAKQRKRKRLVRNVLVAVVALVLVGAGAAFAYYQVISNNLHRGLGDGLKGVLVDQQYATDPFYVLLIGTDGSAWRDSEEAAEYGGVYRSDTMILARVAPKDKTVTLVSLHRDTKVDLGEYGVQKLNAAHAFGGAALTVETVSKLAGVPISHYVEINFDGFEEIVNAVGGIEVDVPIEINDDDAGGHLDAGLQTLNGEQALILCRSRHAYDEYGPGDEYRSANQRLVISAILNKVLSSDLGTIASTVTSMSKYVTTDYEITELVGLAQTMRGLDTQTNMWSAMQPTTSAYIDNIWYEITDEGAWRTMMQRVDAGLPPTEQDIVDETGTILASAGGGSSSADAPRTGTVSIRNGNGQTGLADKAAAAVSALGYTTDTGNADSFNYTTTVVVYSKESQAQAAQEIVDALGAGKAVLNQNEYIFSTDFLVVFGSDYAG